MHRFIKYATANLACLLTLGAATLQAQSFGDFAAYAALTTTPVMGLPHAPLLGGDGLTQKAFVGQYAHVASGTGNAILGASFRFPVGKGSLSLTGGTITCDGCDGNVMLGADWLAPLSHGDIMVGVRPSIGLNKMSGSGGGTSYALGATLPVSKAFANADVRFVPFIEPGIGFGSLSGSGISESGNRFLVTGGISVSSDKSGFGVHVTANKVFIDGGDVVYGVGITLAGGKR